MHFFSDSLILKRMSVFFSNLIRRLKRLPESLAPKASKRRFLRRGEDPCVGVIDGMVYPIENWSMGGVLVAADSRVFGLVQKQALTLKFKIGNRIFDIPHTARVVRKTLNNVAFEFDPLTFETNRRLRTVLASL